MSKKIAIYCGWDTRLEASYVKMPEPYNNLTNQQKLTLLSEIIDELLHERNFIFAHSNNQDTALNLQ